MRRYFERTPPSLGLTEPLPLLELDYALGWVGPMIIKDLNLNWG